MIKFKQQSNKLTVQDLVKEVSFKCHIKAAREGLSAFIVSKEINRPGLALAGWFKDFQRNRIQVFGNSEIEYFKSLEPMRQKEVIDTLFQYSPVCIIITKNLEIPSYIKQKCKINNVTLLLTKLTANNIIKKILAWLEIKLAIQTVIHGDLVEVYGVGILITGHSGLGKSECALELVKRGHQLIADDMVEVYKTGETDLVGQGSEIIKHHIEIRGLGIINVKTLYGVGAIKNKVIIDLMIEIEEWNKEKEYDRVGLNENKSIILGTEIAKLMLPVKAGRNLASIIEVAAMNHRSKEMGYYSANEFNKKLINWIQGK